jgi:hypothetical protein
MRVTLSYLGETDNHCSLTSGIGDLYRFVTQTGTQANEGYVIVSRGNRQSFFFDLRHW